MPADELAGSAFTNGIDISHHQGPVDWGKVAAAGVKYVFIGPVRRRSRLGGLRNYYERAA